MLQKIITNMLETNEKKVSENRRDKGEVRTEKYNNQNDNSANGLNSSMELEDRTIEITKSEQQRESRPKKEKKRKKEPHSLGDCMIRDVTLCHGSKTRRKRRGLKKYLRWLRTLQIWQKTCIYRVKNLKEPQTGPPPNKAYQHIPFQILKAKHKEKEKGKILKVAGKK